MSTLSNAPWKSGHGTMDRCTRTARFPITDDAAAIIPGMPGGNAGRPIRLFNLSGSTTRTPIHRPPGIFHHPAHIGQINIRTLHPPRTPLLGTPPLPRGHHPHTRKPPSGRGTHRMDMVTFNGPCLVRLIPRLPSTPDPGRYHPVFICLGSVTRRSPRTCSDPRTPRTIRP